MTFRSSGRLVAALFLIVCVCGVTSSAQQAQPNHTLTVAELTYGTGITAMAADGHGGAWFGADTCDPRLPTTANAVQRTIPYTGCHGLLGRMTADGSVTYLSYIGGNQGPDHVRALAVDAAGNVYVAGFTYSPDFPTTDDAYDRVCGEDGTCTNLKFVGAAGRSMVVPVADGFVMKLTPGADRVLYSTYIGGQDEDTITAIALGANGIHLTGTTMSSDFPVTAGAVRSAYTFGTNPDGDLLDDAFYARLGPDGGTLQYGTYLGGHDNDWGTAIAVDGNGNAFVAGTTTSRDFPVQNAARPTNTSTSAYPNITSDGFLVRFDATGPVYSTYVGGSQTDTATGVAVDGDRVYLAGELCSADFPRVSDPNAAQCGAYIADLSAAAGAVERTMTLHGYGDSAKANAIAVDRNHLAYIAGVTTNYSQQPFPTTPDAFQRAAGGGSADAFVSIVDMRPQAPSLVYSSYLGGNDEEQAHALALDGAGGVFFGGYSTDYFGASTFPSKTSQPQPPAEPAPNVYQSFTAHVAAASTAGTGGSADIVLYARDASAAAGAWQLVEDPSAAGGTRAWLPDAGVPKLPSASAAPGNYFELTFDAQAGVPYQLWLRMKADNDSWQNDSVFVQFSDTIDASGNPAWRIGTDSATVVSLEDCSGCREQGWGWNDNGYDTAGTPVVFATGGTHTVRIQQREDGISIDQIVLSASNAAPGANKNDSTVLVATPPPAINEVVLYADDARARGTFQLVTDPTAAGGTRLWNPDAGVPKLPSAEEAPANYADITFNARAGVPYHLWLRMKADNDFWQNDSVFVQFTDSIDGSGNPVWRIGSTGATMVSLEDCSGCGERGWGWNDNGYDVPGVLVTFATSGLHTIRIQQREDGISIDQIVLSAVKYLNQPPGAAKSDSTMVRR